MENRRIILSSQCSSRANVNAGVPTLFENYTSLLSVIYDPNKTAKQLSISR